MSRRRFLGGVLTAPAALAAPRAQARTARTWRMVTSWSKNQIGPGLTAARLARRITEMSEGALTIQLFAAGEIVPALHTFDAVSNGTVEMAHTAALFWQGKIPAAPMFTTVPFGLPPVAHAGWIDAGGQDLWDALYAPFGVKPLLAGNTGPSSAGWFRKPISTIAHLTGLRIRATGLGGELYRRLGAVPIVVAPAETYPALERGVIDAAEFLAPANDLALGLHRIAPNLLFPGFNKPNGASELIIGTPFWEPLPASLKEIVIAAARAEHDIGLAEAHRTNRAAITVLLEEGVRILRVPEELLASGARIAGNLLDEVAARDGLAARIVASYRTQADEVTRAWDAMTRF